MQGSGGNIAVWNTAQYRDIGNLLAFNGSTMHVATL